MGDFQHYYLRVPADFLHLHHKAADFDESAHLQQTRLDYLDESARFGSLVIEVVLSIHLEYLGVFRLHRGL
jgi:hypothetical protein